MRALRSRIAGTTSSSESNNPEELSSTQEHAIDERKPKKIRQKKLKKRRSQEKGHDDVFTSVKKSKKPKQNDCPTSSDDTFIKPKNTKKRRVTCLSEIEPSLLFENAVTSTQIKPKKHRKLINEPMELEVAPQMVAKAETITPPLRKKRKQKKTPSISSSTCTSENTTIIEKKKDDSTFEVKNQSNEVNISTEHKSKFILTVDDTTKFSGRSQKELEYDPKETISRKKKKRKITPQNSAIIQENNFEDTNQTGKLNAHEEKRKSTPQNSAIIEEKRNNSTFEVTNQTGTLNAYDDQKSNLILTINETTKFDSTNANTSKFECSPKDSTLTKSGTKVSIFDETDDPNDYLKLDDISDDLINDIIDISDESLVKNNSRRGTFNVSSSQLNSMFIKDMSPDLDHDKKRDTFDVPLYNKSGEWQVQNGTITLDNSSDSINKTPDNNWNTTNKTPRNNRVPNQKMVTMNTPNKSTKKLRSPQHSKINKNLDIPKKELELNTSIRKKWQKYAVNTPEAKAVLGKIYSPKPNKLLSARKSTNESILKNSILNSSKPNISTRKSTHSTFKSSDNTLKFPKSEHKSQVKAMPNFALIHKKAFDKMESIQDYSNRKQERAKLLMSTDKIRTSTSNKSILNKENQSGKSSRQLFSNPLKNKDYNRFGFKVNAQVVKKSSPKALNTERKKSGVSKNRSVIAKPVRRIQPPVVAKVVKPATIKDPIFERKDLIAMGNKNKVEDPIKNRNKRRDDVRGFRTNRRFELLMKMRNNE